MSVFVTDTHPVVWFFGNKHQNLSPKVLAAFQAAATGNGFIYIPAVVLWETAILERKGRIKLNNGFLRWTETLFKNTGFAIAPIEPKIIALGAGYNFNGDRFDEMITAYAAHLDLPLITKDTAITNAGLAEIYW